LTAFVDVWYTVTSLLMRMGKIFRKDFDSMTIRCKMLGMMLLLLAAFSMLVGCSEAPEVVEPTPVPTPTPSPEVVSFTIVTTPTPPAITATPTPEPTATPIPFSKYAPTVNMTYEELVGSTDDMSVKASELLKDGYPDPKTYYIIVDKQWQVVLVYKRIDDGSKWGKPNYDEPVRYMLCSTGNPDSEHGHETTSGIWDIEKPKERFYQFVNLEAAQYLTLIHSRTYFHSVLYDKAKDLSTFIRESYDKLGTKASHACIRLTVPDARWLFYNIGYGTTCEIRDGDPNDANVASIRAQLKLPPSKDGVKLKAGDVPWTDNWTIEEVEHVLPYKYQKAPLPDLGDGDDDASSGSSSGGSVSDPNASATFDPNVGGVVIESTPVPVAPLG